MDTSRRTAAPPVLDMTPDGQFRDATAATPARSGRLDRALARVGGAALLLAVAAGGLLMVALAVVFVGLLLPVAVAAGLVAFGTLWWRTRRLRGAMAGAGRAGPVRFMVIRR